MKRIKIILAVALSLAAPQAVAQSGGLTEEGFRAWLPSLRAEAQAAGVSRQTIDSVFPTLEFSARTVQLRLVGRLQRRRQLPGGHGLARAGWQERGHRQVRQDIDADVKAL